MLTTDIRIGTVVKEKAARYFVQSCDEVVVCSISSKLRKVLKYPEAAPGSRRPAVDSVRGIRAVDPVCVGDKVRFSYKNDDRGMIVEVLPRKSKLSRQASGRRQVEQIIVANVDQVVPVFSADAPPLNFWMLDKLLAASELEEMDVVICLNKMDLVDEAEFKRKMQVYNKIGYRIVYASALEKRGLDDFISALEGGLSALLGPSGVGKSTLLNTIQPGLGLRVQEISKGTGTGKHTTTHVELLNLDFGGMIIDTPGLRDLNLWNVDENDAAYLFPEMREYIGLCRFQRNCSHVHEPGCSIKEATESEKIDRRRYESYVKMRKQLESQSSELASPSRR